MTMLGLVEGELQAARLADRPLPRIRVTKSAIAGAPATVPAPSCIEALAALHRLTHPDGRRVVLEPWQHDRLTLGELELVMHPEDWAALLLDLRVEPDITGRVTRVLGLVVEHDG